MIRILLSSKLGEIRMTQAELARRTGIRPNTISELYHDMVDRVTLEHLDKICTTLGCELSDIMVWVPDDKANGSKPVHNESHRNKRCNV